MDGIDLGSASVFFDFDGTISLADTGMHLLDRLTGDAWHDIELLYTSGQIGSRECILRQWDLLPTHDGDVLRSVVAEVPIDPGFAPLVARLVDAGAEVTIVSDGFGFAASDAAESVGVPVRTATVDWTTGELTFPYDDPSCPCARCGTCKQSTLRRAAADGRMTIFVGDGTSDRMAAPLADILFATGALARWCDAHDLTYRPFSSLRDVAVDLGLPA
ncbi:MAG TPA: HAD-IB family phosphatase [Acidimicrobiales bacterium]|nr:HAD-IB family phosphatase [Acidimicrobiales bacterium]